MSDINTKEADGINEFGKPYKVLIVDDSAFVVKQLQQIFVSEQYNVVGTAENGEEGVLMYKEYKPDLVTMDITMPKMDGITALTKIIEYDKNAKVVMVSALGKEDMVKKALLAGAKNYITKPLDRKKVLERIKMVLTKKQ
ncbi:response regulator [Brachyspira hyodysenteriae]|uniref:Chemotaxis protein CheY n=2 Tax=Brachyspira hyodysenteriae TaxID=159 RepID=A0A3B6VE34_BRAHW|nr:response regulator [Brachyspira hyodysenteriae]ACN83811.1 chemotaxis protein CheY [Brachyspira hyodysenteriae WA1]ANN64070.1 two-component system response regulator [Brachyspira hyodysenteriae ATCC 27164]AUJ49539.1 response regulator [Brachyspira hyodysenteriae]KLI14414.1 chemotaxis protein CheY [Brachyspira hyodysenteriae]KLI15189.1 chemotaxis protein CheY [Brachyspira hyodysenteriae]